MTRASLYLRISRDPEDLQEGTDRQREDCEAIALERDWEVVGIYTDNDTSAYDSARDRVGFQQLMADFQAGKLDAVIVYDVDRMYRRVREAQLLVNQVEDYGLKRFVIASATDDYNLANPDERDHFMNSIRSAEKYSRQIARKLARKNLARARAGNPRKTHIRPFGYEWTEDGGLQIRKTEAALIREAADRILADDSLAGICNNWNRRGILTTLGNQWLPRSLKILLTAPRVAGLVQYDPAEAKTQRQREARRNGGRVEISARDKVLRDREGAPVRGNWKAALSEDVWERLVDRLEDPKRRMSFTQGQRHYLLTSGIAVCSVCDGELRAHRNNGSERVYRCNNVVGNTAKRKGCRVYQTAEPLEVFIQEAVITALAGGALDRLPTAATDHETADRRLVENLRALEADRERLVDLLTEGVLSPAEYRPRRVDKDNEIERIHRQLRGNGKARIAVDIPRSEKMLRKVWDERGMDWRRSLVATVVEKVVVKPKRNNDLRFDAARISIVWKV